MERYPEGLFKTVAANLLKKQNGQKETVSLLKVAAEYKPAPQEQRQQFLQEYGLDPAQFAKDPIARKQVDETSSRAQSQVRDFYKQQRSNGMLDPQQLQKAEQEMLSRIEKQKAGAVERTSINRTRNAAMQNPEQFKQFQELSQSSQEALGKSHGREAGAALGAVAGGALGALGGRLLPKNTKGILQQVGGAIGGSAIGGIAGGAIGSNRDEKRTGFNHEDMMQPYEIADRMTNQQKFR